MNLELTPSLAYSTHATNIYQLNKQNDKMDECMCAQLLQLCLTLCDPMDCISPSSSGQGDSPRKNTGVSCHALFQATFLIQRSNLCLLHRQTGSLPLRPQESPSMGIALSQKNHVGGPGRKVWGWGGWKQKRNLQL